MVPEFSKSGSNKQKEWDCDLLRVFHLNFVAPALRCVQKVIEMTMHDTIDIEVGLSVSSILY